MQLTKLRYPHYCHYSISQEICTRFLLCCGYTLTDFPISIRLTSLALWQSNDCPNASKATLMNMDKYFMWIHYERLYNHNKAKHNKPVCMFLVIYCIRREYRGDQWIFPIGSSNVFPSHDVDMACRKTKYICLNRYFKKYLCIQKFRPQRIQYQCVQWRHCPQFNHGRVDASWHSLCSGCV